MKTITRVLAVSAFAGWAGTASATVILDVTEGGTATCGRTCSPTQGSTSGWGFFVNSTITIDGLGIWDFDADGFGPDVSAGLWIHGGALLASAVISSNSTLEPSTGPGGWRFEDISELVLGPGRYVLGMAAYPDTPTAFIDATFSTIAEVTWDGGRIDVFGTGLVRPDNPWFPGVFGPNLRLAQSTEVPAPATLILFGMGLAGLGWTRRRKA